MSTHLPRQRVFLSLGSHSSVLKFSRFSPSYPYPRYFRFTWKCVWSRPESVCCIVYPRGCVWQRLQKSTNIFHFDLTDNNDLSMAQKRKAVDAELEDYSPAPKRPSNITLAYPSLSHPPSKPPPFQQPTQLLTFSYTPDHILEFNDSALRYYIDPPLGADLGYGYDRWIRRPDERGRIDPLLQAWSRFKKSLSEGPSSSQPKAPDIHVMSWRGIMTK